MFLVNSNLYTAFVIASAVLILVPGPTVLLVTSTSLQSGARAGLIAVLGSTTAAALHLAVIVAGLASVVAWVGEGFSYLRWVGAAYLIYLGISAWLKRDAKSSARDDQVKRAGNRQCFARGFLVTLTNPKTLLFLGAFLPQFVDPALPALPQLVTLAASFLVIAGLLDGAWALLAARVAGALRTQRAARLVDRVSGTLLIVAGAALAAARGGN